MANGQPSIQLSKRELQVLEMVVTGASNQEIAQKLVISVNTVKVHMRNIFEKMEVQSRTEASMRAIQEGWVTVTEPDADLPQDSELPATKTFLITNRPPPALATWQQILLVAAIILALAVASIPFWPEQSQADTLPLDVPVIYRQPTPSPGAISEQWTTHAPMPTGRAGLALAVMDQQIYAIGGVRGNNRATRFVEIYNSVTDSWTEGASKPTATANIAAAIVDNKIYIPGGCTNDGKAVNTLEIYNPKTDTWAEGPPLPEPRCGYGLTAFQNKLYLFGGWDGKQFNDSIFVFSAKDNSWEILEQTLPHPTGYAGAAVLNDAIYIAGGYNGTDEFNQTYRFDPATGEWQEKAALQEKRGGLGLVSSADNLFAIGGGWDHTLSSSEKYDPATDTWTEFESPFNNQWRNLGLAVIDTKIYAVGGWDGTDEQFLDSLVSHQFLYQYFIPISSGLNTGN